MILLEDEDIEGASGNTRSQRPPSRLQTWLMTAAYVAAIFFAVDAIISAIARYMGGR